MESKRVTTSDEAAVITPGWRAASALLAMVLIWALNFSIAKDALSRVPPLAFNALRFPFAAAVVTLAMLRRSGFRLPDPRDWWRIVGLGVLGNVVYQLCFIFGLEHSRAGTASVLLAGTPIVTGLMSAAVGHERTGGRVWIGATATVIGIVIVVLSGRSGAGEDTLLGSGLMVAATFSWAAYSVASRPLIAKYGALPITTWMLWIGMVALVLLGLREAVALQPASLLPRDWFAIIYAGAFSIGVAYVLWSYGVRHLGATRTATFSNLVPVFALVAAWLLLSERPSAGQVAGAAVIITGVTFAQLPVRRAGRAVPRAPLP
jgi:drug/metabolite transporter (DMT)-like permease